MGQGLRAAEIVFLAGAGCQSGLRLKDWLIEGTRRAAGCSHSSSWGGHGLGQSCSDLGRVPPTAWNDVVGAEFHLFKIRLDRKFDPPPLSVLQQRDGASK